MKEDDNDTPLKKIFPNALLRSYKKRACILRAFPHNDFKKLNLFYVDQALNFSLLNSDSKGRLLSEFLFLSVLRIVKLYVSYFLKLGKFDFRIYQLN